MFCSTVSDGSRLNAWKTKPMRSRRSAVRFASLRPPTSTPPSRTAPDVGESRPAAQCRNVLLPEPDGPMTAVKLPPAMPSGHGVERDDRALAAAVDLADVVEPDGVVRRCRLSWSTASAVAALRRAWAWPVSGAPRSMADLGFGQPHPRGIGSPHAQPRLAASAVGLDPPLGRDDRGRARGAPARVLRPRPRRRRGTSRSASSAGRSRRAGWSRGGGGPRTAPGA